MRVELLKEGGARGGIPAQTVEALAAVPPGWRKLLAALLADLPALGWDGTLLQVKEKFGGLRVAIGAGSEAIFARIHAAEEASRATCEECGGAGVGYACGGWWRTLCAGCAGRLNDKLDAEEQRA